jgi:hypothetical protein
MLLFAGIAVGLALASMYAVLEGWRMQPADPWDAVDLNDITVPTAAAQKYGSRHAERSAASLPLHLDR